MPSHLRFALIAVLMAALAAGFAPPTAASAAADDRAAGSAGGPRPRVERLETRDSPLLLRQTDVRIAVTGPVAHVTVTQSWTNPNDDPFDALYIFPLAEKAAVTDMRIRIGDRTIRSEIRRREEARRAFEQARREGRLAGLLDQERPNVFAQEIANLMPGVAIEVVLELDQEVACEEDACEIVFPTVVGPRFVPSRQTDPGRIDPPVIAKGLSTGQILTVQAEIDAGVPIRDLASPSHRVETVAAGGRRWRAALHREDRAPRDRDFRLRWRAGADRAEVGALAWRDPAAGDERGVVTLVVQPPASPRDADVSPREIVFVLDCSGSMSGEPLRAAKEVVRRALRTIRPEDTFQIVRFSDAASALGRAPLPPSAANVQAALAHLEALRSEGGTEMLAGIRAALDFPRDPERLRIVAFLTDGYIGNEREILSEVRKRLGATRLFSFGIGSAVNRYLLEALAEEGRGAAAFLAPGETADDLVERFGARIATPVLTDVTVEWEGLEVDDLEPARFPDLFGGQPLVIHGRYRRPGSGHVVVEGRRAGRIERFRQAVVLPERAPDGSALGRLWARARIHRLERDQHDGERPEIKEAIARLGLDYRLMTAYTSLVAVDDRVSNASGQSTRVEVPVEMPAGVAYEGIFGREAEAQMVAAPASGSLGSALRGLGYVGRADAPVPLPKRLPKAREEESKHPFTLVTLVRADGTRVIVEKDGDVWSQGARGRRLARRLTPAEIDLLRAALVSARPSGWSGSEAGERLVVDAAGAQWVVNLPAGDAAVDELVRLLRHWGS